jgi:hypothetical protein
MKLRKAAIKVCTTANRLPAASTSNLFHAKPSCISPGLVSIAYRRIPTPSIFLAAYRNRRNEARKFPHRPEFWRQAALATARIVLA